MQTLQSHSDSWAGTFTLLLATRLLSCVFSIFPKRSPSCHHPEDYVEQLFHFIPKWSVRKRHLFLKPATLGSLKWWCFRGECFSALFLNLDLFLESTSFSTHMRANTWVESQVQECWYRGGKQDEERKEHIRDVCYQVSDHWGKRTQPCAEDLWRAVECVPVSSQEAERSICQSQPCGLLPRIRSHQHSQFIQFEASTCLRARIKCSGRAELGPAVTPAGHRHECKGAGDRTAPVSAAGTWPLFHLQALNEVRGSKLRGTGSRTGRRGRVLSSVNLSTAHSALPMMDFQQTRTSATLFPSIHRSENFQWSIFRSECVLTVMSS